MGNTIDQFGKHQKERQLAILHLKIDDELVTLSDAMKANNKNRIVETKQKLTTLVHELNQLTEFNE